MPAASAGGGIVDITEVRVKLVHDPTDKLLA
ncbi:MAG: hypothetical protein KatS3mg102_0054 [Planctomycetota bacterium]|nr:MAG: hypothetical protein KatS3mg102_0054 [Planctomycetota bacterium]